MPAQKKTSDIGEGQVNGDLDGQPAPEVIHLKPIYADPLNLLAHATAAEEEQSRRHGDAHLRDDPGSSQQIGPPALHLVESHGVEPHGQEHDFDKEQRTQQTPAKQRQRPERKGGLE
jgi:hypothetical protein